MDPPCIDPDLGNEFCHGGAEQPAADNPATAKGTEFGPPAKEIVHKSNVLNSTKMIQTWR
jgi:hypothetical protein